MALRFDSCHDPDPPTLTNGRAKCPTCKSTAVVSTIKNTTASYWRCTDCGDIWNEARNYGPREGIRPWR